MAKYKERIKKLRKWFEENPGSYITKSKAIEVLELEKESLTRIGQWSSLYNLIEKLTQKDLLIWKDDKFTIHSLEDSNTQEITTIKKQKKDNTLSMTEIKNNDVYVNNYYKESFTISEILYMIKSKMIYIPNIQRQFVSWDFQDMMNLIESVILNFPIQPIYLYLNNDGIYELIDGQHRLLSIYTYFNLKEKFLDAQQNETKFFKIKINNKKTFEEFKKLVSKNIELSRLNRLAIDTFHNDLTSDVIRSILNKRIDSYVVKNNSSLLSSIFTYLNATGVPLDNGEILRAKMIDDCGIVLVNKALKIMVSLPNIKDNSRYGYIYQVLLPFYIHELSPAEKKSFLNKISMEAEVRSWVFSWKKTETKEKITLIKDTLIKFQNKEILGVLKKATKITTLYSLLSFFIQENILSLLDEEVVRIEHAIMQWESITANKELKRKYFSRSPMQTVLGCEFIKIFKIEEYTDDESKGILEAAINNIKNF